MFLGSGVYEINGGRSASLNSKLPYFDQLKKTIDTFIASLKTFNKIWICLFLFTVIIACSIAIYTRINKSMSNEDKNFIKLGIKLALCIPIVIVYLILLCTKVAPIYISRTDVQISWMVFAVMLIGVCGMYILKKIPYTMYIVPLAIFLLFYFTVKSEKVYSEINFSNGEPIANIKAFDDYVVDSVIKADKSGKQNIELKVPKYSTTDNWPLTMSSSSCMAKALYIHGITSKKMNIQFVPTGNLQDYIK